MREPERVVDRLREQAVAIAAESGGAEDLWRDLHDLSIAVARQTA